MQLQRLLLPRLRLLLPLLSREVALLLWTMLAALLLLRLLFAVVSAVEVLVLFAGEPWVEALEVVLV